MIDKLVYEKLAQYCAAQERYTADIKNKLRKLKVASAEQAEYINKLKGENFLNEQRYVKTFVEAYSKKKWGKVKMKSALLAKGANAGVIKEYLDEIEAGEYEEQLKTVAEKKWRTLRTGTLKERKIKLTRFLLGKGFEMGKISAAIKGFE